MSFAALAHPPQRRLPVVARRDPVEMLAAYEDVLVHLLELCRGLPHESADLPTDCPGWTVRDQLAHVVGTEQAFSGSPSPAIELPPLDHVQNDFDRYTEPAVQARRLLALAAICDELAGLLPRRMAQYRELISGGTDGVTEGPFGPRPASAVLSLRTFDIWTHEQDIRRAVDLSPRIDCPGARITVERAFTAWRHGLPALADIDGMLTIEVTEPVPRSITVPLGSGDGPHAGISGDAGVIAWLGCGRGTLAQAGEAVSRTGDAGLLDRVAPHLPFTP
jgi:uncharacterized protein (TIGR03083 family)